MSATENIKQQPLSISEAIPELLQRFRDGGPDTKQRIVLTIAQQAQLLEGKNKELSEVIDDMLRSMWGAFTRGVTALSDEKIDEWIARLMKRAEKRRK